MKTRETRCNFCAECVHCGRNLIYDTYISCDVCGEESIYRYDGKDYCPVCLMGRLVKDGVVLLASEEV